MQLKTKPINGKYLTDDDIPQWNIQLDNIYGATPDFNNTIGVSFIVTEDCNLKCSYCYQHAKTKLAMSKEVAKKAIDLIFDCKKMNSYYDINQSKGIILEFIGGEPFLEIELINYITEYFKAISNQKNHIWKDNYMLSFSTNGTLYNTQEVQSYLKRNQGKVSVGVTVDGNKKLHDTCRLFKNGAGSYDLAASALQQQLMINPCATTKLTICPENVLFLFEAIKSLYENIGCHFVNANCVFEEGWNSSHAEIFYSELIKLADYIIDNKLYDQFYCSLFDEDIGQPDANLDRNWCGGTGDMLAIGVDGTCYPCIRYAPYSLGDNREPFIVGNVWDGLMKTQTICNKCNNLKCITMRTQSTEECLNCQISSGCALCSAYNYEKFGDANIRATFVCEMHKARVNANQYYWGKLKGGL